MIEIPKGVNDNIPKREISDYRDIASQIIDTIPSIFKRKSGHEITDAEVCAKIEAIVQESWGNLSILEDYLNDYEKNVGLLKSSGETRKALILYLAVAKLYLRKTGRDRKP